MRLSRAGWVGVLALACLLAGCGVFGDNDATATPAEEAVVVPPASVRVEAGERWFDIDPSTVSESSLDRLATNVDNLGADITPAVDAGIEFGQGEFVVVPAVDGAEPDIEALADALMNATTESTTLALPYKPLAADVSSADAQSFADQLNGRLEAGIDIAIDGQRETLAGGPIGTATTVTLVDGEWNVAVDYAAIKSDVEGLFPDVGAEGGEASFTVEPGETEDDPSTVVLLPGRAKRVCCDETSSGERIARALSGESDVAILTFALVDGERGQAWAENLGITELVGSFRTRYTPGQSRNINIQRISELTTGVIIEPGETWSLNEFVGQRTRAKGFVPAGTIINGHLIDSVGGGISQYATTIFNAAFFAGLEFERYQSHSIYFSRYPYGREATISWPAPQLEIHNPTPYGVLVWPIATDRSITVELYSTKWVDVEQTGQWSNTVGVACTKVTTERTRTFLDGKVDVDTVVAQYRKEGIACDGTETVNPNDPTTTTTTIDPNAPSTTVDPTAPSTTVDPNAPTTTVDPDAPTTTTTTVAPGDTTTTTTTTTSTTTTAAPADTTTTVAAETSTSTEAPDPTDP